MIQYKYEKGCWKCFTINHVIVDDRFNKYQGVSVKCECGKDIWIDNTYETIIGMEEKKKA